MHPLYDPVVALLRDTAERAILPYYQRLSADQIQRKADAPGGMADLVTIADKEAEALLSEALARLIPDAAIVGEEASDADPSLLGKLADAQCWIIDPVDGTNNFGAGKPPFGIIVALAEAGETVAGWLYDPLTGRICHAHRGHGAFVNGEPVQARETGAALPVAAISLIFMDAAKRADVQARLAGRFIMADIPRCAAEQYPRLVLGVNDVSVFERTLPWDHAAGILFLNEAGGRAVRPDGAAYRVDDSAALIANGGLLGASSPRMWDEAARILYD